MLGWPGKSPLGFTGAEYRGKVIFTWVTGFFLGRIGWYLCFRELMKVYVEVTQGRERLGRQDL